MTFLKFDSKKVRLAEVVDSVRSLEEFIKINKITPKEIMVIWEENIFEENAIA